MMKRTQGLLLVGALAACGTAGDPGQTGQPGTTGDKGDKGDPGAPGSGLAPGLALLTPTALFAGRQALVQVSGVGTHFSAGTTVDFGDPAITVTKVEAGSAVNLRVSITVGVTAQLGPHTVTVTTPVQPGAVDPETATLTGGFAVNPSLSADLPNGATMPATGAQGGIIDFAARNLDARDNPFSTAFAAAPQLSFGLSTIGNPTVSTVRLAGLGLIDALAPAGSLRLGVTQKDIQGQDVVFVSDSADKLAAQVTARTPTMLTAGKAQTGDSLPTARSTNLYKFTTAMDNQVAHLAFTGLGSKLSLPAGPPTAIGLVGYVAPASGRFHDGRGLESSETPGMVAGTVAARNTLLLLPKAGDYYIATYSSDLSGSANHTYSVTARWAGATDLGALSRVAGSGPTMPLSSIDALDKPYFGSVAAATSSYNEDFIRFKATKTGRIYIAVLGKPGLSMGIGLRASDCTKVLVGSLYSASGTVLNEGDIVDGTTYCVRIADNGQPSAYQFIVTQALN